MPHSIRKGAGPKRLERISTGPLSILKHAWRAEITLNLSDGCSLVGTIASTDTFRTWT